MTHSICSDSFQINSAANIFSTSHFCFSSGRRQADQLSDSISFTNNSYNKNNRVAAFAEPSFPTGMWNSRGLGRDTLALSEDRLDVFECQNHFVGKSKSWGAHCCLNTSTVSFVKSLCQIYVIVFLLIWSIYRLCLKPYLLVSILLAVWHRSQTRTYFFFSSRFS